MEEIINRVANSSLKTIDLEDFYPKQEILTLDINTWLYKGLILKEKDFREALKVYNWELFKGKYVVLTNENEAILPSWAFLLVSTYLNKLAIKTIIGSCPNDMLVLLYSEIIDALSLDEYKNERVILKGCAKKPVPTNAYIFLMEKLQPFAKSIMYGEACSTVPLTKS